MERIDRLRALADDLEAAFKEAPVPVKARIAAQYRATLAEIDTIHSAEAAGAGDDIDELASRRAARGGATARLGQAARSPR